MTETAVQAAATAARALGLTVTEPTVLYEAFSTVVHLEPSPVVARVPMNLPEGLRQPEPAVRRQQREIDVTTWLAAQGVPVVQPSHPVPVQQDGFCMTFWKYVEVDHSAEPDYVGATARVAQGPSGRCWGRSSRARPVSRPLSRARWCSRSTATLRPGT